MPYLSGVSGPVAAGALAGAAVLLAPLGAAGAAPLEVAFDGAAVPPPVPPQAPSSATSATDASRRADSPIIVALLCPTCVAWRRRWLVRPGTGRRRAPRR